MAKIAFVFSGQGAQAAGMGRAWIGQNPAADRVFDRAEALRPGTKSLCMDADQQALNQTLNAQPALFCMGLAAAEALRAAGVQAQAVAGFSLGEIPALAFSGMLSLEDAFRLVCVRAEAMERACQAQPGGMVALLGLDAAAVDALCAGIPGAYPVNYNCPGQTVVAVLGPALETVKTAAKAAGGRAMPLAVSGAFHSPAMDSARDAVAQFLAGDIAIGDPKIPLYANRTGQPYAPPYGECIAGQLSSSVRWEATIRAMGDQGIDSFIEVGMGKTLCGLIKKILPQAITHQVQDPITLDKTLQALESHI